MPHNLTAHALQMALTALCGNYVVDVGDESVRLIADSLPGNAVCAILRPLGDGVTRIVYDLDKPHALAHTRAMLHEWWESYRVPVAFPDGTVEFVHQASPRRLPDDPVSMAVAN